ncbi:hypothetical protein PENTCL1PPCAC_24229, partial [Pristionchus entomophagus]
EEHEDKMSILITRVSDSQAKDNARIDELTRKLAKCEKESQALLLQLENQTATQALESVPSSEVVALQQEILKLRDHFQRACLAAKTAEKRVEVLQKLLDTARKQNDREVVMQLMLNDKSRENETLKNEMAQMKKEHTDEIGEVTRKFAKCEEDSMEM